MNSAWLFHLGLTTDDVVVDVLELVEFCGFCVHVLSDFEAISGETTSPLPLAYRLSNEWSMIVFTLRLISVYAPAGDASVRPVYYSVLRYLVTTLSNAETAHFIAVCVHAM